MQNVAAIIARNLSTLMYDRDFKDGQLSKISNVDQKSIWRIKRQEQSPSADTLEKLAHAFGLHAWQLLVPDLDPKNPPVFAMSDTERDLYRKMSSMAQELLAAQDHKKYK